MRLQVTDAVLTSDNLGPACKTFSDAMNSKLSATAILHPTLQQIVLSIGPFYFRPAEGSHHWYTYNQSLTEFKKFVPIPSDLSEVNPDAPLVVLPVPAARSYEEMREDEAERSETFTVSWQGRCLRIGGVGSEPEVGVGHPVKLATLRVKFIIHDRLLQLALSIPCHRSPSLPGASPPSVFSIPCEQSCLSS